MPKGGPGDVKLAVWFSLEILLYPYFKHITFSVKGLGFGIYGPSLMDLAEVYSTTTDQVAMMNSAKAVGMFVGSCVGGFFYNYVNDQLLILIFLIVYGIGTVVSPVLPSIIYLHICGTIAGVAFGIAHIGSQVRLVKIWSDKSASAIQAFHGAIGVGSMIGPFVVAPFLSVRDGDNILKEQQLMIPYGIFGILYVLMSASMIAAYLVDPATIKKDEDEDKDEHGSSSNRSDLILMAILFVYLTIAVNTEHTYGTFISVYATGSPSLNFPLPKAALLAGTYWATFTSARILGVFVALVCDLKQILMLSHTLLICASAIIIIFNRFEVCLWIGTAIMGMGLSSLYGAASGLVFEYIHIRHSYVGAILVASCLGLAVSAYAVPPFIGTWPMFFQYYIGGGHIFNTLLLIMIFLALRGRLRLFENDSLAARRRSSRISSHGF